VTPGGWRNAYDALCARYGAAIWYLCHCGGLKLFPLYLLLHRRLPSACSGVGVLWNLTAHLARGPANAALDERGIAENMAGGQGKRRLDGVTGGDADERAESVARGVRYISAFRPTLRGALSTPHRLRPCAAPSMLAWYPIDSPFCRVTAWNALS